MLLGFSKIRQFTRSDTTLRITQGGIIGSRPRLGFGENGFFFLVDAQLGSDAFDPVFCILVGHGLETVVFRRSEDAPGEVARMTRRADQGDGGDFGEGDGEKQLCLVFVLVD